MNKNKTIQFIINHWIYALFAIMLIFITITHFDFWSERNLQNLIISVAMDGIIVVGMTVAMIGGGFDLSVGSVLAMAGVVSVSLQPAGLPVAICAALVASLLAGALNGFLVTRLKINAFIATLGTMIVVRGAVMTYTDAQPVVSQDPLFSEIGRGQVGLIPVPAIIFAVVLALGYILLNFTRLGRNIYALGGNEEASRSAGILIDRTKFISYVITSFSAGISGVILASRLSTGSPIIGEDTALNVMTAVLLGGTSLSGGVGSIQGSLVGVFTIGALSNYLNLTNVSNYYQRIAKGMLLILVIIIDRLYQYYLSQKLLRTRVDRLRNEFQKEVPA